MAQREPFAGDFLLINHPRLCAHGIHHGQRTVDLCAYPTRRHEPPSAGTHAATGWRHSDAEVLSNATNDGASYPDGEWIELHNTGQGSIDLMGWSIMDGMGNLTLLDPGTLVFNATQGSTVIEPDGRRLVQFTSDTELWDNYNHLFLRDITGFILDTAHYTTDYGEDMALVRGSNAADAWTPAPWKTPGQPEPGSTPSSTTILFSEILPDAVGSDSQSWPNGEWIELYNYGTMDVDVAGWKLKHPREP